jgi:predicted phosphodiesterase
MRVGLISDIHGNHVALAVVLDALRGEVDVICFVGDLCGYYPFVNECVELLASFSVTGVRGNHDQVLIECLDAGTSPPPEYGARYGSALARSLAVLSPEAQVFIRSLPVTRSQQWAGMGATVVHGAPWDPLEGRVYPDFRDWDRFDAVPSDLVVLGHTHHPIQREQAGRLLVNPGSVGQPRDRSSWAAYAVLDADRGAVHSQRVHFDAGPLVDDARRHDPGLPYLVNVFHRD